jgi:hypothetical protein
VTNDEKLAMDKELKAVNDGYADIISGLVSQLFVNMVEESGGTSVAKFKNSLEIARQARDIAIEAIGK